MIKIHEPMVKKLFALLYSCLVFVLCYSQRASVPKKHLYNKESIDSIVQALTGSNDAHFNMFLKNGRKVNEVMGKNFAEKLVMSVITREEIAPYDKQSNPNWDVIEKHAVSKYGALGEERVWGHRTVYYSSIKDWKNFGKYYKKYFDRAVPNERSFLHVNNLSWPVFEHITDSAILATAVKTMKYDIEKFDGNDPAAIDTYANLLYKTGRTAEAIQWEEKAVQLSNNDKTLVETLEKMKQGKPTWVAE